MIAAHAAGIAVHATGGIGGVHRGALGVPRFDGRADASTSRRTSRSSAGRRSRSSAPARRPSSTSPPRSNTSRRGACRSSRSARTDVPGFYARSSGIRRRQSVPDIAMAALPGRPRPRHGARWRHPRLRARRPRTSRSRTTRSRDVVERAVREADAEGIGGPALTPWLLARIATLTDGASVRANTALIVNDARVAGEIARRVAAVRLRELTGARAHPSALPGPGALVHSADGRRPLDRPSPDGGSNPTCGSTRGVHGRTSKRSFAASARSSTSAACATSCSSRRLTGSSSRASSSPVPAAARGATPWAPWSRRR